jgi:hypothetical protein
MNCCDELEACAAVNECAVCIECVQNAASPFDCIDMCQLQGQAETTAVIECVSDPANACDCGL